MSRKRFGTDGIRGLVGEFPITPEFVLKLGWATGKYIEKKYPGTSTVVIGKDTRISGYMFESALQAGLVAAGINVMLLGPISTPAVAYFTRTFHAQAGIVISASHNPYYDNGIKFFSHAGLKFDDEAEALIESYLEMPLETKSSDLLGKVTRLDDSKGRYIEYCKSTVPHSFSLRGKRIVVDCAHGATYHIAANVLTELGADVTAIGVEPDGLNINEGVGSTAPQLLQATVLEEAADLGIALDGDGDRVIFVDCKGRIVDGDELLYLIASQRDPKEKGFEGVVGTLMTNIGVELALKDLGIQVERADVGDRYVKDLMLQNGWKLGGESSGHIICADVTTTGDGVVAALQALRAWQISDKSLVDILAAVKKFPQKMINVRVDDKHGISQHPEVLAAVEAAEAELADSGRVLLRPSGTESVVRVMVEAEDLELVEQKVRSLADLIGKIG